MNSDLNGGPLPGAKQPDNRRSSQRIETHRDVLFSDYQATGPIRLGMAVDMSAGGFRILTRYPEPVGSEVQIELQPEEGHEGDVTLFRGRVVHVEPMEDGEFSMGVMNLLASAEGSLSRSKDLLRLAATAAAEQNARPRRLTSAGESRHDPSVGRRVVFSKLEQRNRKRHKWLPWGSLLILFAILCALGNKALEDERPNARGLFGGKFVYAIPDAGAKSAPRPSMLVRGGLASDGETTDPYLWDARSGLDTLLERAQAALRQGDLGKAQGLFERLEGHPKADTIHRYISLLGHAEASGAAGELSLAKAMLRRAMNLAGDVPDAWERAGRDLEARLQSDGGAPFAPAPMNSLIVMTQANEERPDRESLRIEVDASKYLLKVMRGKNTLRSFPVGLGRDNSTPIGRFQVANKISDPDWYNNGEVVSAGDAANPLGASWMGLGDGDSATSYGFHPTADSASIGKPMSQGCVRMRPRDAETLFRLVPLGTPVHIRR